jgi:hypothetical protein
MKVIKSVSPLQQHQIDNWHTHTHRALHHWDGNHTDDFTIERPWTEIVISRRVLQLTLTLFTPSQIQVKSHQLHVHRYMYMYMFIQWFSIMYPSVAGLYVMQCKVGTVVPRSWHACVCCQVRALLYQPHAINMVTRRTEFMSSTCPAVRTGFSTSILVCACARC